MTEKTPIPPPDWEALIDVIAKDIVDERTPARILQVRAKLYDLLTHCIPATTILKVPLRAEFLHCRCADHHSQTLTFKLMPRIDDSLKADVVKWSAFYEHRIRMGSVRDPRRLERFTGSLLIVLQKVIFHLEAFVAKFMRLYEG